jgi:hypothetical protein
MDATTVWKFIALFILVNGLTYHRGQAERLKAAAGTGTDDVPSAELRALASAPSVAAMNAIDGLAWLAIIYLMVAKPFS